VTLVTVGAVVHIPGHTRVLEVARVIAPMAIRTLEHRIVIRVRVTCRADPVGVAMGNREYCVLRVIEGCTRPRGRGVAGRARSREELRLRRVAGVGGVVVVGLMASDAGRRQRRVVAIHVTVGAYPRWHGV
jgi:hypothetical protein